MRVLVAGSTGVIGAALVPRLVAAGHEVLALVRPGRDTGALIAAGADPVVADVLERRCLLRAVRVCGPPDAVVQLVTATPSVPGSGRPEVLRTDGTRNLIDAAPEARFISQGLAYGYRPGPGAADEDAPLWHEGAPRRLRPVLAALAESEGRTLRAGGLVLRLGHLYGPGSAYAADGAFTRRVRAGKVPLVGGGRAVFSFTHVQDVAGAVTAALARPRLTGVLNIVDDTPTPVHRWLPELAGLLGAPAPRPTSAALTRLTSGAWPVAHLDRLRGASNHRARTLLDWHPRHPSPSTGLAAELSPRSPALM
ncbi:NAD-dependent epimerase/dehydratase family protein [Actinacidiphila alni]|uniref:NAD-dependent epimerase/dehydratase family protein n=1 Tax=Actinacidiphila alni TaxID=380248 RepID=UPI003456B0EE